MAIGVKVKVQDKALKNLIRQMQGNSGAKKRMLLEWGKIYFDFTRRAFIKSSKGGGTWPDITQATKDRKGSDLILIDKGFLLAALAPGAPGSVLSIKGSGIQVGIGGNVKHPSGITIAKLASIHQEGKGNNPARPFIFVPPRRQVLKMIKAGGKMVQEAAR